jgi:hypothetical protein
LRSAQAGGVELSGQDRVRRAYLVGVRAAQALRSGHRVPFVSGLSLANTAYLVVDGPDLEFPVWTGRRANFDSIFGDRSSEFQWRSFVSQAELFNFRAGLGVRGGVREV